LKFERLNVTEGEAETIRKRGIRKISLLGVKVDPQQALAWAAGYERLLIYFDVDVLTYVVNPDHAPEEAEIFGRLIAMLAGSLGNVAA
jgi:hypothetical protein